MLMLIKHLNSNRRRGLHVFELANRLECSTRTVYRYMDTLRELGIEVRGRHVKADDLKRYYLIGDPLAKIGHA
jgi:predicted DNA-binding transcriptional regulator YafY